MGKFVSFVREASAGVSLDEIVLCSFGAIADPAGVIIPRYNLMIKSVQVLQNQTLLFLLNDDTYAAESFVDEMTIR